MKKILITRLRDRHTSRELYRQTADQLGALLAIECAAHFPKTALEVETPLASTQGERFQHIPILVPILRSGIALLPPFLRFWPQADIGFLGIRRDETTAIPEHYYSKLPQVNTKSPIVLLDPMIATGGSATLAVNILKSKGAKEQQITLVSFIGAPEGILRFQTECPEARLIVAQIDERLDEKKYIFPGLGDFGDRYFGTDS